MGLPDICDSTGLPLVDMRLTHALCLFVGVDVTARQRLDQLSVPFTETNAMYSLRLLASKNARLFEAAYNLFDPVIQALDPLWRGIGYKRFEKPFSVVEDLTKGILFDCQMCGHCILSSTGMSCPMNCPKNIRNGPCGGVRANGNCEIKPDMRCVWVMAWEGSQKMKGGDKITSIQLPVDHRIQGSSAWLRHVQEKPEASTSHEAATT